MRVMCEKIYNVPENFDGYSGRVGIRSSGEIGNCRVERTLFGSSGLIIFTRLFVNTIHLHDLVRFLGFCVTHYRIYFRSDNRNSLDRRKWIIVPTETELC